MVAVNYNTRDLVARLVFSLSRVLEPGLVSRIVIVDNRSDDGSAPLLDGLADRGLIDVVHNHRHPYHGPGLNRGLSFLAREQRSTPDPVDAVWILDSDVVVLRPDALAASLAVLQGRHAALLGQEQDYDQIRPRLARYAHPSALLVDPAIVWRHRIPAFLEDGAPAVMMQYVLRKRGRLLVDYPYFADGALLHLGGGTLGALVRDGKLDNRYFEWGTVYGKAHFHGNPDGPARFQDFDERFRSEVGELTVASLEHACRHGVRLDFSAV